MPLHLTVTDRIRSVTKYSLLFRSHHSTHNVRIIEKSEHQKPWRRHLFRVLNVDVDVIRMFHLRAHTWFVCLRKQASTYATMPDTNIYRTEKDREGEREEEEIIVAAFVESGFERNETKYYERRERMRTTKNAADEVMLWWWWCECTASNFIVKRKEKNKNERHALTHITHTQRSIYGRIVDELQHIVRRSFVKSHIESCRWCAGAFMNEYDGGGGSDSFFLLKLFAFENGSVKVQSAMIKLKRKEEGTVVDETNES